MKLKDFAEVCGTMKKICILFTERDENGKLWVGEPEYFDDFSDLKLFVSKNEKWLENVNVKDFFVTNEMTLQVTCEQNVGRENNV